MHSPAVSLQQLLPDSDLSACPSNYNSTPTSATKIAVSGVKCDSRTVTRGDVFVAIPGVSVDGHRFVDEAIANGACAIVTQAPVDGLPVPQFAVTCTATAFAKMSMTLRVGSRCPVVCAGITGTNGKTTTSWMLRSILQASGLRSGLVGTIEASNGAESFPSSMTTPSASDLADLMQSLVKKRTSHCVLEISSHALVQKRCEGLRLSAAAITNITQDHFDYHQHIDAYRAAKASIANLLHPDAPLLLNVDDPGCQFVMDRLVGSASAISFGVNNPDAELQATVLHKTHRSQRIRLRMAQGDAEIRLRLIGHHNVANSIVAAGLAEQLGVRLEHIVNGLESLHAVPGRLERIDEGQPFQVLVDYAHTPDAIARSVGAIREFVPGRILCVFGAGGDRDPLKRPLMGEAAAAADYCIVTSDNPRSEAPEAIMQQVATGFPAGADFETIVDRREAIAHALDAAEPGDVVLIAGKGHETVQVIGDQTLCFEDRSVARELLQELTASPVPDVHQPVFLLPRSA